MPEAKPKKATIFVCSTLGNQIGGPGCRAAPRAECHSKRHREAQSTSAMHLCWDKCAEASRRYCRGPHLEGLQLLGADVSLCAIAEHQTGGLLVHLHQAHLECLPYQLLQPRLCLFVLQLKKPSSFSLCSTSDILQILDPMLEQGHINKCHHTLCERNLYRSACCWIHAWYRDCCK